MGSLRALSPPRARIVLQHSPDLARQVLEGSEPLNDAYASANIIKADADTHDEQLAELRERYPDLADLVTDEELTLKEALAAADVRDEVDLITRAAGWVSDAVGIDSPPPGNARTAPISVRDGPEYPQEDDVAPARISTLFKSAVADQIGTTSVQVPRE